MLTLALATMPAHAELRMVIMSGLGGEPQYAERFLKQATSVAEAATRAGADPANVLLLTGEQARRSSLDGELKRFAQKVQKDDQVAVVLIGHGAYDGEEYRLNLPGPDLTGGEIETFLDSMPASQILVVNATSSSGATVERWKAPNRIIITATRSGTERNATRFAEYWVEALSSPEADRDKNDIVTAAEAFEFASRKVADTFKSDAALATEHARIDGKMANNFVVARLGEAALLPNDAALTAMLQEQAGIEQQIEQLRGRKETMDREQYYNELEQVLITLAQLDRRIDARKAALASPTARETNASGTR